MCPIVRKLLVIDDQAGLTRVVALIATQLGFNTRTVNDALLAGQTCREFRPDMIIVDMIMPERDGIDVLHDILQTGMRPRIVLTSGFSESMLNLARGVAKFHGIDTVSILRKPFRRQELVELLECCQPLEGNQ
jgi:CheY-like chemotaxis protein